MKIPCSRCGTTLRITGWCEHCNKHCPVEYRRLQQASTIMPELSWEDRVKSCEDYAKRQPRNEGNGE
jgi:hypothetical protein